MPPKRKKPSHQLSPAKRLRRYRNEESQSKTQERLERNRQRNRATRRRNDLSRTAYQTASSPSHCMPLRSLSPLPSPPPPQQPPPPQPVPAVAARSYPPIVSSVSVDEEDQLPPPVSPVASRCSSPTSVISEDEEDQPISEDEGDQPSNAPSDPYANDRRFQLQSYVFLYPWQRWSNERRLSFLPSKEMARRGSIHLLLFRKSQSTSSSPSTASFTLSLRRRS